MIDLDDFFALLKARRDVRDEFLPTPLDDKVVMQLLDAAHHAPSVGFQQPWNFILIRSEEKRRQVHDIFQTAQSEESEIFQDDKKQLYHRLKLEGILKAPLNLVVTCDKTRDGPSGIGRFHNPQMSAYSCVCAVQNLWLAARAQHIGVGWVSIYHEKALRALLHIPDGIEIIAYLCLGFVSHFYQRPELEEKGWRNRLPLEELIFNEEWSSEPK